MTNLIYVGILYVTVSSIIRLTVPAWMKFVKLFAGIMLLIAISPIFTFFGRMGDDLHEVGQVYVGAKQGVKAVSDGIDTVTSWPDNKESIPYIGTGSSKYPPGLTFMEKLRPSSIRFDFPVSGVITQEYKGSDHHGIDIAVNEETLVRSAREGKVVAVNSDNVYGNYVMVDHGGQWVTLYAHLSKVAVKNGDKVWGTHSIVGLSGGTKGESGAGNSTGPHLHFEIRVGGKTIDPQPLFK